MQRITLGSANKVSALRLMSNKNKELEPFVQVLDTLIIQSLNRNRLIGNNGDGTNKLTLENYVNEIFI